MWLIQDRTSPGGGLIIVWYHSGIKYLRQGLPKFPRAHWGREKYEQLILEFTRNYTLRNASKLTLWQFDCLERRK